VHQLLPQQPLTQTSPLREPTVPPAGSGSQGAIQKAEFQFERARLKVGATLRLSLIAMPSVQRARSPLGPAPYNRLLSTGAPGSGSTLGSEWFPRVLATAALGVFLPAVSRAVPHWTAIPPRMQEDP
jgi:hypothetical protein